MHRIAPYAADHHGTFTMVRALAVGIDRHDLGFALRSGELLRIHRGVYRFAGAPPTWEGDVLAACWAAGTRGFASHRSAAALHALPGGNRSSVSITCPRWRRAHHDGIVVHETTSWMSRDIVTVDRIPTAGAALTLLQLSATLPRTAVESALENALRRGLTTLDELDDLLRRYARRGRPGVRTLRGFVRERSKVTVPTASERETALLQVIRAHGLPDPVRQFVIRDRGVKLATVDLAYPDARIAIEYDSDEFHTGRVATSGDSERRHRVIAAGWLPVTAVSSDIRSGGELLCRALRAALDARRSCADEAHLASEPAPLTLR